MTNGTITVSGSSLGTALNNLLLAPDIQPGAAPSYELCKVLYEYHPLGAKMVEAPIAAAQSQQRKISVGDHPDEVRDAFLAQWDKDGCDGHVANVAGTARMYGIGSLAVLTQGEEPASPLDFDKLAKQRIAFNMFDPLNTAGSLTLNQDPNSMDFQKHAEIAVAGKKYHRSRSVTLINEKPIYISYTDSAYGFSGRSVYQRALFPLKSFVQTMVTDDMVSKKAGLLIAFIKMAGSIADGLMARITGQKRSLLKVAVVDNVLSMGADDRVESLNLQNLDGAFGNSRTNILKNIATAAKMPAVMLENETLTEGFGEGTEDAKIIAKFVGAIRAWMKPVYDFLDPVAQRRAWNADFIKLMKNKFAERYGSMSDAAIFFEWTSAFAAPWPNLLEEPDSEKIKVSDVKYKAALAAVEILAPMLDADNKVALILWLVDNMNEDKLLFGSSLQIEVDDLLDFLEQNAEATAKMQEQAAEGEPGDEGAGPVKEKLDSAAPGFGMARRIADMDLAISRLPPKVIRAVAKARA